MKDTTFVGLDVHKDTIAVAVARVGNGDAEHLGSIPNTPDSVAKLMRRLGPASSLQVCYEAGPCGYALFRQLKKLGIQCLVVAPSLVPQRAGDRVKTDRRDALNLARLLRSGELTPVWVPDEEQEALRDLVRAREDAVEDRLRKRHQLSKFLLRLELRPPAGVRPWSQRYRKWLDTQRLPQAAQQIVLKEYIHALDEAEARIKRLEAELAELAESSAHAVMIAALQALRRRSADSHHPGGRTRRHHPVPLCPATDGLCRLVPSEDSSGPRRRRGGITRTGNAHVRRVIVEAAWHYRHAPGRKQSPAAAKRAATSRHGHRLEGAAPAQSSQPQAGGAGPGECGHGKEQPRLTYVRRDIPNARPQSEVAPDGSGSCGIQPANIRLIHRRICPAHPLPPAPWKSESHCGGILTKDPSISGLHPGPSTDSQARGGRPGPGPPAFPDRID